jgi:RES domain-containing protein
MTVDIEAVPVTGIWFRHVPCDADPLGEGREPPAGRWQPAGLASVYVASDEGTMWAEWYRHLAEEAVPSLRSVPRDCWRLMVRLPRVADLSTRERLARAGLRVPRPGRETWPAFQELGAQLAGLGSHGVLSGSAARPSGRTLCVYLDSAPDAGVRPLPPAERISEPPAPPRGMRT